MILFYKIGVMLGRLSNGFESDHGKRYHAVKTENAVNYGKSKGLCGAQPGKRSVGWYFDDKDNSVTCPKCLKKIAVKL